MPIGKVWIYWLLFVCLFVILSYCTVTDFSAGIKLVASKFARRFTGVLGRESPILGKFAPLRNPKSDQSATTGKYCLRCISLPHRKRHATDAPFVEYCAACGRRSACVDIRPSPKMDILVLHLLFLIKQLTNVISFNSILFMIKHSEFKQS